MAENRPHSASLAGKTAGTGVTFAGKAARVTKAQALKMAATPSWDKLKAAYDYQAGPPDDIKEEPADTDSAMVLKLTFTGCNGKPVEGVFMRPKAEGNYPVALVPHGLTNNKEIAVKMFGNALVAKGIAILALDAPGHGHNEPPNKSYWNKQVITLPCMKATAIIAALWIISRRARTWTWTMWGCSATAWVPLWVPFWAAWTTA